MKCFSKVGSQSYIF